MIVSDPKVVMGKPAPSVTDEQVLQEANTRSAVLLTADKRAAALRAPLTATLGRQGDGKVVVGDIPKRVKRLLREYASAAHEEGLHRAFLPPAEAWHGE